MILLTRLNGPVFALNPDLVERADCTPDTVITLVDGTKYVVAESLPEFVTLVQRYRASVLAEAQNLVTGIAAGAGPAGGARGAAMTASGQRMVGGGGHDERAARRVEGLRIGGPDPLQRSGDLTLVEGRDAAGGPAAEDDTDPDNVVPLYRRER